MHAENIQSLSGFTIEEAHKMLFLKHVKQVHLTCFMCLTAIFLLLLLKCVFFSPIN